MKTLIKVGDFAWLDPNAVDAVIDVAPGAIVILRSGEQVTLHGMTSDEVLDRFAEAVEEVLGHEE